MNTKKDARTGIENDTQANNRVRPVGLGLKSVPAKPGSDFRVKLKVSPVGDWPDSDLYTPCEADRVDLGDDLILSLARSYNTFLCSLIRNSMTAWRFTNRSIMASLDVMMAGVTPHKLCELVEHRMRSLMVTWMGQHDLLARPSPDVKEFIEAPPRLLELRKHLVMEFACDGDMVFWRDRSDGPELLALVVINASVDAGAALEQYVSGTNWFRGALAANPRCENILLSVDDSAALTRRINEDGLVTQHWNLMPLLARPIVRDEFFTSLFRSTLAL